MAAPLALLEGWPLLDVPVRLLGLLVWQLGRLMQVIRRISTYVCIFGRIRPV